MSATGPTDDKKVYQLKVTLLDTSPPVWRRFLAPAEVSLDRLHLMLQQVMGWENYHLYRFQVASAEYSELDDDEQDDWLDYEDSRQATLGRLVSDRGTRFLYVYDFGDNWRHELRLEDVLEGKPDAGYPLCVGGRRACPPEDCGGPWGYAEMLEVVADPDHPEHLDRVEWLGEGFDPDAFDAGRVNRTLDGVRQRRGYTEKQGQYLSFIYYYTISQRRYLAFGGRYAAALQRDAFCRSPDGDEAGERGVHREGEGTAAQHTRPGTRRRAASAPVTG